MTSEKGILNNGNAITKLPSTSLRSPEDVNSSGDVEEVPFEKSLNEDYRHAVHGMIWAPWSKPILKQYNPKAAILMQMRFDGHVGFPGGMVDEDVNALPVELARKEVMNAFLRELEEEMNLDSKCFPLGPVLYHFTHLHPKKKLFLHFYSIKLELSDLESVEVIAPHGQDFAEEVMGNFRVPLYTMMDGFRGLPAFLCNLFCGTAKEQLLDGCKKLDILSADEISEALVKAAAYSSSK